MNLLELNGKKDAALVSWSLKRLAAPERVRILLPEGARASVKPGEHVLAGTRIAEPQHDRAAAAFASISGTVTEIGLFSNPSGGRTRGIEILSDGKDEREPCIGKERPGNFTDRDQLLEIFQSQGLVDMGGSLEPLHAKLRGAKTLIIDAAEAEPYVTADHSLIMSHPLEILKGAEFIRIAAGAEKIILATQTDKMEPAELLKSKIYFLHWDHCEVRVLPARYPAQGILEKRLGTDRSITVHLASAFAAYEAVALCKPLYERAVSVAGECIFEPRNVWARIGTDAGVLIKACRGFLREPRKVVMGGPMRGYAQTRLDIPITAGVPAVIALPKEVAVPDDVAPCIRCGRCIEACPMDISPVLISLAAEQHLFDLAHDYGADRCIDCGNCSYVCPSKRPMTELVRYAGSSRTFRA
jgi:Na+-translocating ferredoxin:NAD+ oxidoreductase subunit C